MHYTPRRCAVIPHALPPMSFCLLWLAVNHFDYDHHLLALRPLTPRLSIPPILLPHGAAIWARLVVGHKFFAVAVYLTSCWVFIFHCCLILWC
ncbi:hypothetical protein P691DRAFT_184617 [Macrolepiota fuliginosa MF-IS2]|uniref:Uncharacterized protein n=1 Tax=Macrolepiota fuliginosa MF-IS2 TaxID=1400762 RepID=A0A9P5XAV9_9AGAR|nr:hypothetical protein P691DRAFT_184617 [Macrolepiota fuliginosa MF-IS2]